MVSSQFAAVQVRHLKFEPATVASTQKSTITIQKTPLACTDYSVVRTNFLMSRIVNIPSLRTHAASYRHKEPISLL